MTLVVKNWDKHFENAHSRKVIKAAWLPLPNKMDSKEYKRIVKRKDSTEIFTAWIIILQVSSKMPKRGVLKDEDGDITIEDLSLMSGFPEKIFEKAIPVLESPKIAWLVDDSTVMECDSTTVKQDVVEQNRTEQKGMEQNGTEESEDIMPKEIAPIFYEVAEHLKKRVLEIRQQKITNKTIKDWANVARLMNTYDNRTIDEMHKLIDECHNMEPRGNNGFTWRNNILSMSKMRMRWNEGKIWIGMNNFNKGNNYDKPAELPEELTRPMEFDENGNPKPWKYLSGIQSTE